MFKTKEFTKAWEEWNQHMQEKTHDRYTATAERKALSTLWQRCSGREQLAIDSINHSIEHNWNAIYLKPLENGTANKGNATFKLSEKRERGFIAP